MMLPKKLYHYSANEVVELKKDFHDLHRDKIGFVFQKPHGLWFSVEDFEEDENWKTWCEHEEFRIECLKYKYHIKIKDTARIAYLYTPEAVINFGLQYSGNDPSDFGRFMKDITRPPYIYWLQWEDIMK
jgi:hypothetical protein